MKSTVITSLLVAVTLFAGCAEMGTISGPKHGDTGGTVASHTDRNGRITALEVVKVDGDYKLGVGTVVGSVAGAAAGTVAESKMKKVDVQRVIVQMSSGGQVIIVQPVDSRLRNGMNVRVESSGETGRVVPR